MKRSIVALFVLHFIVNALVLWLGYYWLGIGESNGWRLAWSAIVAVLFITSAVWLHGTAFVYFEGESERRLATAAKTALRHVLPLAALAVCGLIFYGVLRWVEAAFPHRGFVIASYLTMKLRTPVRPETIVLIFSIMLWLVRWLLVPALLLPLAAAVAIRGWRGVRGDLFRSRRNWIYWIEVWVLLVCSIWLPVKLLEWVPEISGFRWQMVSFLLRISAGYLVFVVALLVLAFITSAGNPRLSQSKTVSSP
jgi:hypothetical protein